MIFKSTYDYCYCLQIKTRLLIVEKRLQSPIDADFLVLTVTQGYIDAGDNF